jgi:hypothetical protein
MKTISIPQKESIHSCKQLMKSGSRLSAIVKKVELLNHLNQSTQKALNDSQLNQHCRASNFDKGCFTLEVDSAAWATRLRFFSSKLLSFLKSEYPQIKEIQIRIRPFSKEKDAIYWEKSKLSSESAEMIKQTATFISDELLKAALLKLARNT